ncbi:MAG TPA: hypothetical protein VFU34_10340 [Gaiellaceae bacterium]|nr:hypothetical protein [Gaiellaceae bacterium]
MRRGTLLVGCSVLLAACVSPRSCLREISSGKRKPTENELVGTWRMTAASIRAAAATGLPEADLKASYLTLDAGGACIADMLISPCGSWPEWRLRARGEACRWTVASHLEDNHVLQLEFGDEPQPSLTVLYMLDGRNGLTLWQHVCDPDSGEFVDYVLVDR